MGSTPRDSDDAIATKTLEGVVTSWNGGAERLFGYTATEMVGRPITTLFPPERLGEEADFLRRLSRGEQVDHYETVHVRKDGRPIDVSVTLSPLRDADGTIFAVSKIARDISLRKRAEAMLREEFWRVALPASETG
jgi:PAS domain S-box-containing protein